MKLFRTRNLRRVSGERGATAVEYGLVIAGVVAIASMSISQVTGSATDELGDRGQRVGNPDDAVEIVDPGGDTGGTVGDDYDPGGEVAAAVALDDLFNRRSTGFDPKWQASVDVLVTQNVSGEAANGVTVTGEWQIFSSKGTKVETVDCSTNVLGQCTMTADGLKLNGGNTDDGAWFVYTSITTDPDIYTWDAADDTTAYGDPPAVLVCRPGTVETGPPGSETCS